MASKAKPQPEPQLSVVQRIRVAGGGHVSEIGVTLGGFGAYDVEILSDGSWRFASDDEVPAAEEHAPEEPVAAEPEAPTAEPEAAPAARDEPEAPAEAPAEEPVAEEPVEAPQPAPEA